MNHNEFISSSIIHILEDVVSATSPIGSGIETYPIWDYILQSTFLKMTGYQEQKIKCIAWELATHDYAYRRVFTGKPLGECSSYEEKQAVYKALIAFIKAHKPDFEVRLNIRKPEILLNSTNNICNIFKNTNLSIWSQRSFEEYQLICGEIKEKHFAGNDTNLFTETNEVLSLRRMYKQHLYLNRNKLAHNTHSYKQNLPTLAKLINADNRYDNYFLWFSILVLIDEIFLKLFGVFLEILEERL